MLQEPSQLDEAQMRSEFRRLYREIGEAGCMQVMYEMIKAGQWLAEIMLEEKSL